ncbi:unnamed protein product [Clonostachys solani]|uniref:NACHT domain-containing protein n=1 Tax=Clonostachys solani TaxID=160281 RepID=A0A9N9YV85_9HYPO|nr:unnamed protein product [Clonostachys solani]
MDPVSAFGLAASVAQFVMFTSTLISQGTEIYRSSSGLSSDGSTIEAIYGRLHELSMALDTPAHAIVFDGGQCMRQVETIAELSRVCKADCAQLLGIVASLKVEDGSRSKWKSFRAALKAHWKNGEIAKLEDRLEKTQTTLTLQICTISSHYHAMHERTLRQMQTESERLRVDHTCRLEEIQDVLKQIEERVRVTLKQPEKSPFSPMNIGEIEKQLSSLTITEEDINKQQSILRGLTFERRTARHADITDAHRTTFEWMFKEDGVCEGNFLDWLKRGNGIFWVSGKPGSGKSTLMKFVADHHRTAHILSTWSYPKPTYVASHYFWSAGTAMQRSQQGLLQTLLYDIFRQCPNLLEVACSRRWSETDPASLSQPWSLPELRVVLKDVADQTNMPGKFCFFVDGLDEFKGEHLDLCQDLKDLSQSLNIKLCISSRRWNVFEDSFANDPTRRLYIHELTNDDIRSYTEFRLFRHPRWTTLESEVTGANSLIAQVTKRAHGVFLWVFLVTKLLREGLTNGDSFSDLRRRLESFPSDLVPFFKHMLGTVESFYHEKMSGVLAIAIKAKSPLNASIYHFHDCEYDSVDYALKISVKTQSDQESKFQYKQTKRRLNGWCRGLLEVKGGRVDFLHRTVMDFLRTAEMSEFLRLKNRAGFNANLSILRAYTAWIKATPCDKEILRIGPGNYNDVPLISRIREAMEYACELEDETEVDSDHTQAETELLDTIETAVCTLDQSAKGRAFPISEGFNSNGAQLFFREHVIKIKLLKYLSHKIGELDYFGEFETTPLAITIHSELWADKEPLPWTEKCIKTLELLLANGEDPNDQFEIYTKSRGRRLTRMSAWGMLASWIIPSLVGEVGPKFIPTLRSGLLSLFLRHKADPNALVWRLGRELTTNEKSTYSSVWRDMVLVSFQMPWGLDAERYLQVLDDFLNAGANSELASFGTLQGGQLRPTIKETILEEFFERLEAKDKKIPGEHNLRLLAAVADKLLSKVSEETLMKNYVWKAVHGSFPGEFADPIRDKYLSQRSELWKTYWPGIDGDLDATQSVKSQRRKKRQQAVTLTAGLAKESFKKPKM